jgi:hypothetical protein
MLLYNAVYVYFSCYSTLSAVTRRAARAAPARASCRQLDTNTLAHKMAGVTTSPSPVDDHISRGQ